MADAIHVPARRRVIYTAEDATTTLAWTWQSEPAAKLLIALVCLVGAETPDNAHRIVERISAKLLKRMAHLPGRTSIKGIKLRVMRGTGSRQNPFIVAPSLNPAAFVSLEAQRASAQATMVLGAVLENIVLRPERTDVNLNNWL